MNSRKDRPYDIGLRLGSLAADEAFLPARLSALKQTLDESNLRVCHLNGFPYGQFHRTEVKRHVYIPDWSSHQRLEYTLKLAHILARIMPEDENNATISTVPFGYRGLVRVHDCLPTTGDETGRAFRDIDLEAKLLEEAHKIGLGAQFGGKYLAHDIRVIRLPRHGASCPIGLGVSCSADRNIKGIINKDGVWLEKMDANPSELIPEEYRKAGEGSEGIVIDLDKGIDAVRAELTKYPVSTRVSLNGTIIVARDIAHAKLKARLDAGEDLPQYFKDHPILYAGPAKTPEGYPCGSMGPTTANRMDPYVDEFQDHGGSLVMIAKGNRTQVVTDACQKHGGFYLGTIGGIAAVLSQECITSIDCVEYPELGMEAIWKITVKNFPAFILVDDKGHDFFKELKPWAPCKSC